MSYKNTKTRTKLKKYNNKNNRKKKKRINKKNLTIMILVLFISISGLKFFISKATTEITKLINGKTDVAKIESEVKGESIENIVSEEQFNLNTENLKQKKHTIFLDPGHGGNDPGNLGVSSNKVVEKDLSLIISKKVAKILSNQNDIEVIISRTEDKYISKSERADMANSQNADILVSIHLNAQQGDNSATGVESYYSPKSQDDSNVLAKKIQETIISYIDVRDRGIKEGNLEVLNRAGMPAVLIECGFLTNQEEEKKLSSDSYQNQLAEGIAQGILSYLDNKK